MKTTLLSVLLVYAAFVSNGQWSYTNLIVPRENMGCGAIGSKVYFAGGSNDDGFWSIVEEYNLETQEMTLIGNLSVPRQLIGGTTTCGSKIFFGGGFDESVSYNVVDIYDTTTHVCSVEFLSVDRFALAAVSHGDTVMFAGGVQIQGNPVFKTTVDIYDIQTNEWSVINLSLARMGIAAAVVNDQAIFAGGMTNTSGASTNKVDIYNFSSKTWSTETLSLARAFASATTVGTKVIISGGVVGLNSPTSQVDIYDASDGSWTTSSLSIPRSAINNAATINDKAYFVGGGTFIGDDFLDPQNRIDIYDPETNTWTIDSLSEPLVNHSVVGINIGLDHYLVVAGGKNDQGAIVSTVEIFYDPETGIPSQSIEDSFFRFYPNPANDKITVSSPEVTGYNLLSIFNVNGKKALERLFNENEIQIDISALPRGIYFVRLQNEKMMDVEKMVKD